MCQNNFARKIEKKKNGKKRDTILSRAATRRVTHLREPGEAIQHTDDVADKSQKGGVSRLVCLHERKRRDGIFGVFGRVRTHSIRRWYSSNFRYNPLFTPGLAGPALLTGRLI